ncbi:DnaJ domain-containing protein [Xylophilus sp. Kf1]|nr:DnaJ domain-containing protein [Xylophilus sp. Kf1]
MDFKDYYRILGIERGAGEDDIRKAYRKLARKFHPDVSKEPDAEARMREVNEANDVLRDKEKRAAYDALADQVAAGGGAAGGAAGGAGTRGFQPPPGWDQGYEFHRGAQDGPTDHAEFSDFFSSIFGAGEQRGRSRQTGPLRGDDHHAAIEVSLHDAMAGAEREISLRAMETGENGQPTFRDRTLSIRIPPGVRPGQFIRLARQGLPGHAGGEAGDLFLEVRIAPHPLYRIEGRDIYMDLPVTPSEAALGAQVEVPLPSGGRVEVTVPANARSGLKLRVKHRGFGGDPPGHFYLLLQIALPPADQEPVRAAYRALAQATASFDPRRHLGA